MASSRKTRSAKKSKSHPRKPPARKAQNAGKPTGSPARSKAARGSAGAKARTNRGKAGVAGGDMLTARNLALDLTPLPAPPARVTAIRAKLRLSQAVFAQLMGVSVFALRSWEQGAREASTMARRLLDEMEAHPAHWMELLQRARKRK